MRIPNQTLLENNMPVEHMFDLAIREGNSKKPIYRIHKWWARRLGTVFRSILLGATIPYDTDDTEFWKKFYSKNQYSDLRILDPFMGGGTSVIESRKMDAKVIGVDIDPIAWFVTRNEVQQFDNKKFTQAMKQLDISVGAKIREYYQTKHVDKSLADVVYFFWVDELTCPQCNNEFHAHPHYKIARDSKNQFAICHGCGEVHTLDRDATEFCCIQCKTHTVIKNGNVYRGKYTCLHCSATGKLSDLTSLGHPPKKYLFAVEYLIPGTRKRVYKKADQFDWDLFQKAIDDLADRKNDLLIPDKKIFVDNRNDARPVSYGYEFYHQLFNDRQLLCLSLLFTQIVQIDNNQTKEYLLTAFSDSLTSNNLLCSYAFDYQKLTPLFGLHAYNMVTRTVENNVWGTRIGRGTFKKCANKLRKGKLYATNPYEFKYPDGKAKRVPTGEKITSKVVTHFDEWADGNADVLLLNQSSENLAVLPANIVDLILTDPPYFDNLSYSELSDFFYAWLSDYLPDDRGWTQTNTPYQDALFEPKNGNSKSNFLLGMSNVFCECQRVLRENGLMVFTFHHRKTKAWFSILHAIVNAQLTITNVFPVRSEGRSAFHSDAGNIKWDSVVVCRKRDTTITEPTNTDQTWEFASSKLRIWSERLEDHKYGFGWADEISLLESLAIQHLAEYSTGTTDTLEILKEVRQRYVNLLDDDTQKIANR